MLEQIAHAKVNLALHVIGQRDDGYHLLDSLVVFTEFCDVISVAEAPNASSLVSLKINGPFSGSLEVGANNLVSRAALALGYQIIATHEKPTPVEITLTKNLPIASGIGGGSADAAATLLVLQAFWQSEVDLYQLALALGADISMCLYSKPLRAQGVGEKITLINTDKPQFIVLVNPNLEVPTPATFKKLKEKNNAPMADDVITDFEDISSLQMLRNDLQLPAIEIEPEIASVLSALKETDAKLVRMSGSGATCFGLYESLEDAQMAAKQLKSKNPNWWCIASATTVS